MTDTRQARVNATIPTVRIATATYVTANTDGTAQVNFGEGEITVRAVYHGRPEDQVIVLRVDDSSVILGPAVAPSPFGTVTADNGDTVTVTTMAGVFELPIAGGYLPIVDDAVAIANGWVVGDASNVPDAVPGPGAPSTGGVKTLEFRATDSGTYYVPGGRYNRTDVYAVGTGNNIGAWFYGATIADTIPDSAIINKVEIYIPELWSKYPGTPTTVGTHTLQSKSGAPSVSNTTTIATGTGWRALTNAIGDALKTGAGYGIGTGISGEQMIAGRASDANSGLLRITFTT